MHPIKVPGPDGMPALFYQKTLSSVNNDVYDLVLNILNNGFSLACINETNIVLILKIKDQRSLSPLRFQTH